ncbi:phage tail terminator family protein [Clostridium formicaceticum]|uniref:Uncharacterized protein n=1 Tax=Clostridium formicaceticum TaxID=1497 RepID=A0AAC9RLB4_9CLOT|nr:hypothetical protein [Clostridium formicaceticum]AOY76682.1 hypothetical protein BJL90_12885 [Clostridium formicaceticum]ARE87113.1 hypothetical protein CLFO_14990 [Clostridium formicaceticum]
MVKYKEIHKAIVNKIKSKFEDIEVTSTDVAEGITRPSFFISFDNLKATDFMNEALDREITVRLYYFPRDKHKNKIELLNMQDDLNDLFLKDNTLKINQCTNAEIEELALDIVDKVLHCYFDLRLSEEYDRSEQEHEVENIEELQIGRI